MERSGYSNVDSLGSQRVTNVVGNARQNPAPSFDGHKVSDGGESTKLH